VAQSILGGAAVHRCDNWLHFIVGFSRGGEIPAREALFQQPAGFQECRKKFGSLPWQLPYN